jgi:hypothetical protein
MTQEAIKQMEKTSQVIEDACKRIDELKAENLSLRKALEVEREKSKVGLTDEEIFKVAAFGNDGGYFGDFQWQHDTIGFVKAIESKLKEKNA